MYSRSNPRTSLVPHGSSRPIPSSTASNAGLGLSRVSSMSSDKSISTGFASGLDGNRLLEEDENGILGLPQTFREYCDYPCIFFALDCDKTYEHVDDWKTHVLSHFRTQPTPTKARCPLCGCTFADSRPREAWHSMLDHLAQGHFQHGHSLATSRFDYDLFQYLFAKRIISDAQFKALQMSSAPGAPAPQGIGSPYELYTSNSNGRHERRRMRQRRGTDAS